MNPAMARMPVMATWAKATSRGGGSARRRALRPVAARRCSAPTCPSKPEAPTAASAGRAGAGAGTSEGGLSNCRDKAAVTVNTTTSTSSRSFEPNSL